MKGNDFLDSVDSSGEFPEPNIQGDFDCTECRERVFDAYCDYTERTISWKCSSGHVSTIKALL